MKVIIETDKDEALIKNFPCSVLSLPNSKIKITPKNGKNTVNDNQGKLSIFLSIPQAKINIYQVKNITKPNNITNA